MAPKSRRAITVTYQRCTACQAFFGGNGSVCDDCLQASPLEQWKEAARQQYTQTHVQADTGGGAARAWSLSGWVDSLKFSADLAQKIGKKVCPDGKHDEGFILAMLRTMPQDEGAVETLLEECGALQVLAKALTSGAQELTQAGALSGEALNDKFLQQGDNFEMSYGSLSDFFGGLEKFIGAPDPKLRQAMKREHTALRDADTSFTTMNYGISTTPRTEWLFATGGAPPAGVWPSETKNCKPDHRREPKPRDWLVEEMGKMNSLLAQQSEPELTEEEAIGLRLYTGPMFQIYNTLLRAIAHRKQRDVVKQEVEQLAVNEPSTDDEAYRKKRELLGKLEAGMKRFSEVLGRGNSYTTTIHVINSGLVKLGKIQKAVKVYRGLSGGLLPKEFWLPNQWGVCGGVENGFLSTTGNRDVAVAYAASDPKKAGTIFEIQMSMVDRAANLQWISQYPHEAELCFAPLTGLQVLSTRVEKSVLVVEARLNVNLVSLTIEEVIAKRHKMLGQLCRELCDEVEEAVARCPPESAWATVSDEWFPKDERGPELWRGCATKLRQSMATSMAALLAEGSPQDVNDSQLFIEAIRRAVDIKENFEQVTPESVVSFMHPALADVAGMKSMKVALLNIRGWPQLPNLVRLELGSVTAVKDEDVAVLAERCPGLQHADLGGCQALTDAAVTALAKRCAGLRHAEVSGCRELTDAAVLALAGRCANLQHAAFTRCEKLTDAAVAALAERCAGLQHADFSFCKKLTDAAVRALAERCAGLRHAAFYSCDQLTDAGVIALAERCAGLRYADFRRCPSITAAARERLLAAVPGCKWA